MPRRSTKLPESTEEPWKSLRGITLHLYDPVLDPQTLKILEMCRQLRDGKSPVRPIQKTPPQDDNRTMTESTQTHLWDRTDYSKDIWLTEIDNGLNLLVTDDKSGEAVSLTLTASTITDLRKILQRWERKNR